MQLSGRRPSFLDFGSESVEIRAGSIPFQTPPMRRQMLPAIKVLRSLGTKMELRALEETEAFKN